MIGNFPESWRDELAEEIQTRPDICRRGILVFARDGAKLPPRCICCNTGVAGQLLEKRFTWHEPVFYLILCMAPLLYPILRPFIVRRATVHLALCPAHLEFMRMHRMIRWALGLASALVLVISLGVLVFSGSALVYGFLFALGCIMVIGTLAYPHLADLVRPHRIDPGQMQLQGLCPEFMDSLTIVIPKRMRDLVPRD